VGETVSRDGFVFTDLLPGKHLTDDAEISSQ
jgi:hypothetical protein